MDFIYIKCYKFQNFFKLIFSNFSNVLIFFRKYGVGRDNSVLGLGSPFPFCKMFQTSNLLKSFFQLFKIFSNFQIFFRKYGVWRDDLVLGLGSPFSLCKINLTFIFPIFHFIYNSNIFHSNSNHNYLLRIVELLKIIHSN